MAFYQYAKSRPLPSHNFLVFIGLMPLSFSKVSSIEISIETEALAEGGENRFVHSLSKPVSSEKALVLEKGVASGLADSAVSLAANTALRVGSYFDFIILAVLDQGGMPKKLFVINDAILRKRSFSDLDAINGQVLIESLEFVYEDLTEVPGVGLLFAGVEYGNRTSAEKLLADEVIRLQQLRDPAANRSKFTAAKN